MTTPTLSVVIAGRDCAPTIGDALLGIELQGLGPDEVEVIMVDDGSTDDTPAMVDDFTSRLRLTSLRNESSAGVSAARNRGLEHATGKYITYLDADDWYAPGYLRTLTDAATGLGVDFVKVDYVLAAGYRRSLVRSPCAVRDKALDPRAYILPPETPTMVDYPACWTGVYSRAMADRGLLHFDPDLRTSEDRPWTWRMHLECDSFATINAAGLCYRKGSTTALTAIYDERQLDFIPAFSRIVATLRSEPDWLRFEQKAIRNFLSILYHQINGRSHSMTPEIRRQLIERSAQVIRSLDADPLAAVLETFGKDRIPVIRPALKRAGVA